MYSYLDYQMLFYAKPVMNKHEYEALASTYQTTHNYKAQAEKIAVEAFLAFDDTTKARFFRFLEEVYADKIEVYHFFYSQYAQLRVGRQVLTKHQKRDLLAVILPFLSKENQFYLILCEVLDKIQTYKQSITYQGKYRVSLAELKEMYERYETFLRDMNKLPCQWFHEKSYHQADRQEVLLMVRHIQEKKLQASIQGFKQDAQIIATHPKKPAKWLYFVYFLGVEVEIYTDLLQVRKLNEPTASSLPTLQGAFAKLLQNYNLEETTTLQELEQKQAMHLALLEQDLSTTLTHYQQSSLPTKRVEASITLQGGGGIVRFSLQKSNIVYHTLYGIGTLVGACLCVFSVWKGVFLLSMVLLVWLVMQSFKPKKDDTSKGKLSTHKANELYQSHLAEYKKYIAERKEELAYIYVRDNVYDKIKDAMYWRIKQKKLKVEIAGEHYDPVDIINLYIRYAQYIQQIQPHDIDVLYALEGTDEDRTLCLRLMKDLFMKKLEKSYKSFINLANLMIHHKLKFKYCMFFIDKECYIAHDYVQDFYANTEVTGANARTREYDKAIEKFNTLMEAWRKIAPAMYVEKSSFQKWLVHEIEVASKHKLKKEFEQLDSLLKDRTHTFVLAGEEGVLLYSRYTS